MKQPRDPNGHFIAQDAMLVAWLPTMMSWLYLKPLETAIEQLQTYCEGRFRHDCRVIGQSADWETGAPITGLWQSARMKHAQRWLMKRDVLRRAIEELAKIDAGEVKF